MKPDWTPAQTDAAMQMRAAGDTYAVIGARFERTAHAVKRHLQYRRDYATPTVGILDTTHDGRAA